MAESSSDKMRQQNEKVGENSVPVGEFRGLYTAIHKQPEKAYFRNYKNVIDGFLEGSAESLN